MRRGSRACVVSQRGHPGDARLEAQVAALRAAGLRVDVLCVRRPGERRLERDRGGVVARLPSLGRRRAGALRYVAEYASFFVACLAALALAQPVRRYRLVLVTNLPDVLVFAALVPRLAGARIVFDVRECSPEMLRDRFGASQDGRAVAFMSRLEQAALGFADATVTCTEAMRTRLVERGADPARITTVLNVGPARLGGRATDHGTGGFRVVTHGTILARYGHEVLLRAMAELVRTVPDARLEILGDGPLRRQLEALAGELGLGGRVRFLGFVPRQMLLARLREAHVGVVPVLRNPESDLAHTLKMFEYLDLGLPVVASRTRAVAEALGEEEARLVEPGDPAALAAALAALAADDEARRALGRRGARAFEERFAPERQRERLVAIVRDLLGDRDPRPGGGVAAVVWAPSERRTELFAERLGASLHRVHWLAYKRPLVAPFKYVLQAAETWLVLRARRPDLVFVTNPPVVAALCVAFFGARTRTPFVMDTHPPALFSRKWRWTLPMQRALARRALVNVVDQERFRAQFAAWGARAVVLENPPAVAPAAPGAAADGELVVVNTFAADEPLAPLLEAARRRPDLRLAVLGDRRRAPRGAVARAPDNVAFPGYLRGEAYWRRLAAARAVVALTTYPHSLLGGAQDAIAVGRPLVLSDQPALREHFTGVAVFADNSAGGLLAAFRELEASEADLRAEVLARRERAPEAWAQRFAELDRIVAGARRRP